MAAQLTYLFLGRQTLETMFQIAHKLSLGWTTRAAAVSYFDRVLQDLRDMPMNGRSGSESHSAVLCCEALHSPFFAAMP